MGVAMEPVPAPAHVPQLCRLAGSGPDSAVDVYVSGVRRGEALLDALILLQAKVRASRRPPLFTA